jgi:hypothetical protein
MEVAIMTGLLAERDMDIDTGHSGFWVLGFGFWVLGFGFWKIFSLYLNFHCFSLTTF